MVSTELLELCAEPGARAWRRLCEAVELACARRDPPPAWFAALDVALAEWPDALRTCPASWFSLLIEGRPSPRLGLLRALRTRDGSLWDREDDVLRLSRSPGLASLRRLELSGLGSAPAVLAALLDNPNAGSLRWLGLDDQCFTAEALAELERAPFAGTLEHLRVSNLEPAHAEALGGCALRLRSLDLSESTLSVESLRAVLGAAFVGSLEALDLRRIRLGPAGAEVVASAPLERCRCLRVGDAELRDEGAAALARSTALAAVERIDLSHNWIGLEGARALAGSPLLRGSTHVDLCGQQTLAGPGVTAIVEGGGWGRLETLELSCTALDDAGLAGLCATALPALRGLDVSINRIGERGLGCLAGAPWLETLETLELWGNEPLTDAGLEHLARAPLAVKTLSLTPSRRTTAKGLAALLRGPGTRALRSLALRGRMGSPRTMRPDDAMIGSIAACPALRGLEHLSLSRGSIGDAGLVALARSEHLRSLRTLELGDNFVGDAGLVALVAAPWFPRLTDLDLSENMLGEASVEPLVVALPAADLRRLTVYKNDLGADAAARLRAAGRAAGVDTLELVELLSFGKFLYRGDGERLSPEDWREVGQQRRRFLEWRRSDDMSS